MQGSRLQVLCIGWGTADFMRPIIFTVQIPTLWENMEMIALYVRGWTTAGFTCPILREKPKRTHNVMWNHDVTTPGARQWYDTSMERTLYCINFGTYQKVQSVGLVSRKTRSRSWPRFHRQRAFSNGLTPKIQSQWLWHHSCTTRKPSTRLCPFLSNLGLALSDWSH